MFNIFRVLYISIITTYCFHIFSENIEENNNNFEILETLYSKNKYDKVIEICIDLLKSRKLSYSDEIYILTTLGDAYFDNNEKKNSIETYKLLLNKYKNFENKDYVLYRLCCCAYKRMPRCSNVDLDLCKDVIYYCNYSKKYIKDEEYLKEINKMIFEAICIIEESKMNEIKFFYDNKLYISALTYIKDFIENYNNRNYINEINLMKAKCLYEQIKLEVEKVKTIRKNKMKNNNDLEKKYFENIIKYLQDIRNISTNNLKDYINNQIDDILLKSEEVFLTVF